jgi:hypothetical protein
MSAKDPLSAESATGSASRVAVAGVASLLARDELALKLTDDRSWFFLSYDGVGCGSSYSFLINRAKAGKSDAPGEHEYLC